MHPKTLFDLCIIDEQLLTGALKAPGLFILYGPPRSGLTSVLQAIEHHSAPSRHTLFLDKSDLQARSTAIQQALQSNKSVVLAVNASCAYNAVAPLLPLIPLQLLQKIKAVLFQQLLPCTEAPLQLSQLTTFTSLDHVNSLLTNTLPPPDIPSLIAPALQQRTYVQAAHLMC